MSRSGRRGRFKGSRETSARLHAGEFVRVAGTPVGYRVEQQPDATRIDHLTARVRAGNFGTMEIALNTYSLRNFDAGFDGRIRMAIARSTWSALPPSGVTRSGGLDYAMMERAHDLVYVEHEREELETLLIDKIERAMLIEGWGDFYLRAHPGIHQVHSRRSSCAVVTDILQRDGAIQFYFQDNTAELLLLKYCGQA